MAIQEKSVKLGKEFELALEAIPAAGYTWEADFDSNSLTFKEKEFSSHAYAAIGGGGRERFVFVPIRSGQTTILMRYKRPWEIEAVKEEAYKITVYE